MEKKTDALARMLLDKIYTTETLKLISGKLEELSQQKTFLSHADAIVSDNSLTEKQKQTQLSYLIRTVDEPLVYDFLSDVITDGQLWLFRKDTKDYFDAFVQRFQMGTEDLEVVFLVTAIELTATDLRSIVKDLGDSFGVRVVLNHQINPGLVGGIQVRVGNTVFDLSLRTKFRQFQKQWLSTLDKTSENIGRHKID
jgi:F0F1-type ATP synthase delta subunit